MAAQAPSSVLTKQYHDEAMDLADKAVAAFLKNPPYSRGIFAEAFQAEEKAAQQWISDARGSEPTRSILCRSAAALAMRAHKFNDAERLCAMADIDSAPAFIKAEVEDIRRMIAQLKSNPQTE